MDEILKSFHQPFHINSDIYDTKHEMNRVTNKRTVTKKQNLESLFSIGQKQQKVSLSKPPFSYILVPS